MNGLRIFQTRLSCAPLTDLIQQVVVGRRYLKNDLPMGIVEGKVGGKQIRFRRVDGAASSSKVKNQIIDLKLGLKDAVGLANELRVEKNPCSAVSASAIATRVGYSALRAIPKASALAFAFCHAKRVCGLCCSARSIEFSKRIYLGRINLEPGLRHPRRIVRSALFSPGMPHLVRRWGCILGPTPD